MSSGTCRMRRRVLWMRFINDELVKKIKSPFSPRKQNGITIKYYLIIVLEGMTI